MHLNKLTDNSFAQKGSGGNPGDRVYPSGQVWDQGSAGLPWVRPDVPHHDVAMGLTWLVRVEARRVPPKVQ